MIKSNEVRSCIKEDIAVQDVREELIAGLQWVEDYLPRYYGREDGYV